LQLLKKEIEFEIKPRRGILGSLAKQTNQGFLFKETLFLKPIALCKSFSSKAKLSNQGGKLIEEVFSFFRQFLVF
jgi:hypothetical protein